MPDVGLGGFLREAGYRRGLVAASSDGAFKVPTLRNVAKTAPYGHNGVFVTLPEIVHFYNTRDVPGAGWNGVVWDPPEVPANVNIDELGNLGLTRRGGVRSRRLPAHAERQGRVRPVVGPIALI